MSLISLNLDPINKQYKNLKVYYDNTFHDRFIINDKKIFYHLGTSLNYLGVKTFAINLILEDEFKQNLLNRLKKIIKDLLQ